MNFDHVPFRCQLSAVIAAGLTIKDNHSLYQQEPAKKAILNQIKANIANIGPDPTTRQSIKTCCAKP